MSEGTFTYDVFLSHSSKDKAIVRDIARRLKKDGVRVWLDEEQIKPGDSIPAKIEDGLENSRMLLLCMSANAFGSDWAQLEAGTFRFRDPLNKKRRFIPLRLDEAPIKGSLEQFLYISWYPADREREYENLLNACRSPSISWAPPATPLEDVTNLGSNSHPEASGVENDYVRRRRDSIERVFSSFEQIHAFFFKICIDYISFVEILYAGLSATDADRTKYHDYIKQIGERLHEMHILEGRLSIAGAEHAVRSMQQYRLQATEVNDMLRLQLPTMRKDEVKAVTDELFRRKERLYEELAKALKEGESKADSVPSQPVTEATATPIGNAWSGLRGLLLEYSTKIIKGILGKAGLPIAQIDYRGTHKAAVLDEADKLVSSMEHADRNRFVVGCIQEIIVFERGRAANLEKNGINSDSQVLQNLRQILARFGHDLTPFEVE